MFTFLKISLPFDNFIVIILSFILQVDSRQGFYISAFHNKVAIHIHW